MRTPQEWRAILAPERPWQQAYPRVVASVKETLADVPAVAALSTATLVERLWPLALVLGEEDAALRARLFRALRATAVHVDGLREWNVHGLPKRSFRGQMVVPRMWANFGAKLPKVCPSCRRPL